MPDLYWEHRDRRQNGWEPCAGSGQMAEALKVGGRVRVLKRHHGPRLSAQRGARLHQRRETADSVLRPRDESRLWPWRQNRRTLDHGRPSTRRGRRRQVPAPRNTSFPKDPATAVIPSSGGGEYQPQTIGASDMSTTRKSSGPQLVINSPEDEAIKTADLEQIESVDVFGDLDQFKD